MITTTNEQLGEKMLKDPNHVYKLSNALYGLKQTPRAWYEVPRTFPLGLSIFPPSDLYQ